MNRATTSWTRHEHANADQLAAACATRIDAELDLALRERGAALAALAGGRTSPPVFRRLAIQFRDWSRVTLLPSDERWVAADHADCNLRQMREAFAGAEGIRWLSLVPALPHGAASATFANGALAPYPQAFDVCMLGMGADGHFASLFPGAPTLAAALDPANPAAAVAIEPDPMPAAGPHPRVSLTLARILRSRRLLLVISGQDKRAVLERALAGDRRLPVAALLAATHLGAEIHWSP
jgi:6-phosphogluconolactonase